MTRALINRRLVAGFRKVLFRILVQNSIAWWLVIEQGSQWRNIRCKSFEVKVDEFVFVSLNFKAKSSELEQISWNLSKSEASRAVGQSQEVKLINLIYNPDLFECNQKQ